MGYGYTVVCRDHNVCHSSYGAFMCHLVAGKKRVDVDKELQKTSNCILNSESTASKAESWQSPLDHAAKTRTMVIACHI